MVGRWGGEEFLGVLPHTDPETLRAIAERLRVLVSHSWADTDSGTVTATISAGGTVATPADSAESLLKRADHLMYVSKENGRNRVTVE
jgi:diguanylate cyclase (GGDEF)-like protein